MGQDDCQFKAFIRFSLGAVRKYRDEPDEVKKAAKLDKMIGNLQ